MQPVIDHRLPAPLIIARGILLAVIAVTLFPLTAVVGAFFSLFGIALGINSLIIKHETLEGILWVVGSVGAIYGLNTLCELLKHYWRTPWQNPRGREFTHRFVGVTTGWFSLALLSVAADTDRDLAFGFTVALLSIAPVAFLVSLIIAFNAYREHIRRRRASRHMP